MPDQKQVMDAAALALAELDALAPHLAWGEASFAPPGARSFEAKHTGLTALIVEYNGPLSIAYAGTLVTSTGLVIFIPSAQVERLYRAISTARN